MNKKILLGIAGAVVFIIIAGGVFWWWNGYGQYKNIEFVSGDPDISSPEEYTRYYEALRRAYAEDQYGGVTPEETLQLFIDALKAGDVELASKYFVVEEQGKWTARLKEIKDNDYLINMVTDLESAKPTVNQGNNEAQFIILDKDGVVAITIDMVINTESNKWKIEEL